MKPLLLFSFPQPCGNCRTKESGSAGVWLPSSLLPGTDSQEEVGEQGQKATRTTDCLFPVPSEGHKATLLSPEKAECATVKSIKEKGVRDPGRLLPPSGWTQHPSIQYPTQEGPKEQSPVGETEAS